MSAADDVHETSPTSETDISPLNLSRRRLLMAGADQTRLGLQ
jgi:hypothetical protein